MMKKILIVVVLALFGVAESQAQTPGYMGKKFSIGYKFHYMPGLGKNPSAHQDYNLDDSGQEQPNRFKINTFHEGFIEIVEGKRLSFVVSGVFSKAQFSPLDDNYSSKIFSTDWAQFISVGGTVGARYYLKHLAPLSTYVGMKVGWQQVIVDDYTYGKLIYNDELETTTIASTSGGSFVTGFEIGTNQILFDRLVINYSFELKAFLSSILTFEQYYNGYNDLQTRDMVNLAIRRMQMEQLASFGIGVGFLP